jgi:hypothetical protein
MAGSPLSSVGADKAADKAAADKQRSSKIMTDDAERRRKVLLNEINSIDNRTNVVADNGLFDRNGTQDYFVDIQNNLRNAREKLYTDDLVDSEYYTSLALRLYDKALYSTSRFWRFSNVYAGPIWIYLVGFLVGVLAFYWYQLDMNVLKLHVTVQEAALHAATWGCVGAILRGLWYLKDKVTDRKYRNSFRIYFISVPFLGGLFGAILYFLVVAGLFIIAPTQAPPILSNQTSLSSGNNTTTNNTPQPNSSSTAVARTSQVSTLAIIPLATLAGFNWEWAIMIFKRIGDSFKGETEPEDKIGK